MSATKQATGSPVVSAREDKHLSIARAIDDVDGVIKRAQTILDRALGNPASLDTEKVEYAQPNLNDFLDHSGNTLRDKIDTLHSQLEQIDNILF